MKKFLILFSLILAKSVLAGTGFKVETSDSGFTVTVDGKLFTRYVIDQANKPYFYPVIGPTGVSMTRAFPMEDIEGERQDHPHHRGINFGHHEVNGYNTWLEAKSYEKRMQGKRPEEVEAILSNLGATLHKGYKSIQTSADRAVVVVQDEYVDHHGNPIMQDERTYTFREPGDGTRIIDIDITLSAPPHVVTHLADEKDSGLSIRVPHSISVDANQGGVLINSRGQSGADAWGKRADWCDYSGPVGDEIVGVAFMNHPSSFRYPTPWHARTYGLLTANPFGTQSIAGEEDGTLELQGTDHIYLRHRFLFHSGDYKQADIADAWKAYASEVKLDSIFSGVNLDGWKANVDACWSARGGILHAQNDPDKKGDILQTEKSYKDFIFQADFKFGSGLIDTGIFLRDNKEQIQIGESGSLKRDMTALPYIPGKGYPIQVETAQEVFDKSGWNTIKVKVFGNTYTTWLNGREIMTYTSDTIQPEGPIGIQVHPKREMSVQFRNILVSEL